jgi:DNA-binding response OmpR family regulator
MSDSLRILLVEDDSRLAELIRDYLSQQGFTVIVETRGDTGLHRIIEEQPDLVILDLMLPGMDGLSICRLVRREYRGPILILTAREDDTDQVVGLEMGADDYVKKPIEPRILLARIRALLRRAGSNPAFEGQEPSLERLQFGSLRIDRSAQTVFLEDQLVEVTTNEFALLWTLAANCGRTLDRETLFKETRGISYDGLDRSVDIAVSRLRKKLGDSAAKPWRIKTIWGQGYLFVKDAWSDIGGSRGK